MQGNQNLLCGPVMRSNCCSHSTTRHVSCKKGSISSAARTRACSPPLLLLLLWDVTGFRGQRHEVEGWGDGVIVIIWKVCRFIVHMKMARLRFRISPPWDPFSKSVFSGTAFTKSVWTVGQNNAIHVCFHKRAFSCGRPLTLNRIPQKMAHQTCHIKLS